MRKAGLRSKLTAIVAVSLSALGACKSEDAADAFIDKYCSALTPCCAKPSDGDIPGSGCRPFYSLLGKSGYDAAKGDACLAEVRANRGDPTFCSRVSQLAPSCGQTFRSNTGTKRPGEPCMSSRDCAPSNEGTVTCGFPKMGDSAICKLEIVGKDGDTPCTGTRDGALTQGSTTDVSRGYVCDLASGLYCNQKTTACERTKPIGADCTGTDTSAYACGVDATCSGGKCVARPPSSGGTPSTDLSLLFVCSISN